MSSSGCGVTEDQLWGLLDGTEAAGAADLRRHVEECGECEQRLAELEPFQAELVELGRTASVPKAGAETLAAEERRAALDDVPDQIGDYKILDVLGEGGMGRVYLAEQTAPITRRVALKVIRPGMSSKEVVARFEAERQALALMSHPNIARVYDAGATEEGRPYFVLEHVAGVPLTEFCDKKRLDLRARVALFQKVCHGVQHAHQKGILHRDLKPGNVLVRESDGLAEPKIIDFGVAKALQQRLTERTLYTEQGRILGTPEYMSPEQAEATALDVDTRSDIYSLGVMLYELLVGVLPFESKALRRAGYFELQRIICEDEPPRPSTRASTRGIEQGDAARRRGEPRALARALSGDLDWITMRCLEKDPARRYASASELAADLQRHLDDEPVEAGPPSAAYRLKKLLRKRRGPVAAGAAVIVALILGLSLAVWQFGEARASASIANESLESYRRMRDVPLVEELVAEAQRLWPAVPEQVPAMDAWLARARALVAGVEGHRAELGRIRARQRPPSAEERAQLAELTKRRAALAAFREELRQEGPGSSTAWTRNGAQLRVTKLEQGVAALAHYEYLFVEPEDHFQHQVYSQLIDTLDRLAAPETGLMAQVSARRERAASLAERSIEGARSAWDEAIAAVRAADGEVSSVLYSGIWPELTPQLGLVPVGMDPASRLWEFAVLDTGEVPQRDSEGQLVWEEDSALVLVLIPDGSTLIGAQRKDPDAPNYDPWIELGLSPGKDFSGSSFAPPHELALDAFFLSKCEMSLAQWRRVLGEFPRGTLLPGAWRVVPNDLRIPVILKSWYEAREAAHRFGLALPTEAQWEYAARAGTPWPYWTGPEPSSLVYAENLAGLEREGYDSRCRIDVEHSDPFRFAAPVSALEPNPFGLHHVLGNVAEWCSDLYAPYTNPASPYGDNPARPGDGLREPARPWGVTVRGGSASDVPIASKVFLRGSSGAEDQAEGGLRLARPIR